MSNRYTEFVIYRKSNCTMYVLYIREVLCWRMEYKGVWGRGNE